MFVERAGSRVERRDAEKHIRRNGENAALCKFDQPRADSATARSFLDAYRLDVANECAAQVEDDEAEDLIAVRGDVDLAGRISYQREPAMPGVASTDWLVTSDS